MKKVNFLSKAEMKNVMGGLLDGGTGGGESCTAYCDGRMSAVCGGTCSATNDVGCDGTDASGQIYHRYCDDMLPWL